MADGNTEALLVVDVQVDFCPGGALPVPDGDRVVAPLNRLMASFLQRGLPVFVTRDWHPPRSRHFRGSGGAWPPHCIRETPGARFHPGLAIPPSTVVVSKGLSEDEDGYSAFESRDDAGGRLADLLRARNVRSLLVGGLATDWCVKATVLDALRAGFDVTVVTDAVAAVEATPGDGARAVGEMEAAGAVFRSSAGLV